MQVARRLCSPRSPPALLPPAAIAPVSRARSRRAAPRTADGKVDFSGIWSPDRNFIYDLHDALEKGETLPLQPWAEKLARERLSKDDPEALCLPTGVPRQAPYPWRIVQTANAHVLPVRGQHPQLSPDLPRRPEASRGSGSDLVRPLGRSLGRRHAGRGFGGIQRQVLVRFRRDIPTPRSCTSSNAIDGRISITSSTRRRSRIPARTRSRSRCTATRPISTRTS